jgi:ribosome-interacting GTPase 1
MPANLTHKYQKAEEEYRRAQSPEEQIACLEHMLQVIPKHKGTEKLQADLKSRLKEARAEQQVEKASAKKRLSYRIPRQGAGTVVVIGGPNAGKSRVLAELSNAAPEVAPYPFTTREPFPAMMRVNDVLVQLIDTPPVTDAHFEPYINSFARTADLVLLCMDGSSDDAPDDTVAVIRQLDSRKTLLAETTGFDENDFSRLRVKTRIVVTRADDPDADTRVAFLRELLPRELPSLRVEFDHDESRESLRNAIFEALEVIRVYTKAPGSPAVYEDPFTVPMGGTVEDLATRVHRDLAERLKFARIWGAEVHDGQSVGREHVLRDGDMLELHT